MTGYGDAGEELVGRLAGRLGSAPHQLTLWQRGLTWHPAGLTQHVWAEHAGSTLESARWRVHIRTWCLKRVVVSSTEMMTAIGDDLPLNAMCGVVRKPGSPSRIGLATSIRVSDDRIEWTSRFVAALARLQAHDAVRLSRSPAVLSSGAAADIATEFLRPDASDIVAVPPALDPHLLPPLALDQLPFHEVAEAFRTHDGVRAIASQGGVTASFPWFSSGERHDVIMLEMRLAARKGLGKGVWCSLSLPLTTPVHLLHALGLNEAETTATSATDLLGGWIPRAGALLHDSFVPWSLCSGEVIRHLADSIARRVVWLRQAGPALLPAEWSEHASGRILPFRRPS